MASLFGEEFEIQTKTVDTKKLIQKVNNQIDLTEEEQEALDKKKLKSKKISLKERIAIIAERVYHVLGKQKDNVLVVKTKEELAEYVDLAIQNGRIAIDTETNNSLDPVTCKLMGLCLYTPGQKQVYIPVNHVDIDTRERLPWQLTEEDCKDVLNTINQTGILQVFHNGKFDYEVLKCTCHIDMKPTWDTMVGARLLNENEPAGLKWQYTHKIDATQEKYDIESLFEKVPYAVVPPEVFALYAATDAFMTDKLYELQVVEFEKPEYGPHLDITGQHEIKGLRWLFHEVEMPITVITAEMELTGVCVDLDLGEKLHVKYTQALTDIDLDIENTIKKLQDLITAWRLTPEANAKTRTYVPKKSKMTQDKILKTYPKVDEDGNRYKEGKPKTEQLSDPINLSSPTQLAILFFDILAVGEEIRAKTRKTGKDELKLIKETLNGYLTKMIDDETDEDEDMSEEREEAVDISEDAKQAFRFGTAAQLADKLLKRRAISKLVTTYIEVIPDLARHWPDGRIRFHMSSLGTDTGRYSSGGKWHWLNSEEQDEEVSGINIQNIPSRGDGKICRLLFKAAVENHTVELNDNNCFVVPETDEVETPDGWKYVEELKIGDTIYGQESSDIIRNIVKGDKVYYIQV